MTTGPKPLRVDKKPASDPSHDFLRAERSTLDAMFRPRDVAVIGATDREGSVGRTVLHNLLTAGYKGRVYPINPKRNELLGVEAFPAIGHVPDAVDMAVIVTPAATVPGVVRECVDAGVRAIVCITAGFRERGPEGLALEMQVRDELRRGRARLIGPNCYGLMNPAIGLNATFSRDNAKPGNVAFISQSGALLAAILDWSLHEGVGFSAFVSTGSMLDVSWGDLIYYLGDDPHTQSILLYMESIGDAHSFLSAAREVALTKPIIVIKAGRTEQASKAAASHTGTLTGSDDVLDAAFRRCGVLRVNSIADVFYMAEVLGRQPRPTGPRLTILTNAGGPGVLATDALIANGGELTALSDTSLAELNSFLPPHWSRGNPIDILGDADSKRYARALSIAAADANTDGLLAILVAQGMSDPMEVAQALVPFAHSTRKPVLASFMGGPAVAQSVDVLNKAGIPTFSYPDTAARAFDYMWRYSYNLRGLYETPTVAEDPLELETARKTVWQLVQEARGAGRTLLTEEESKRVLSAYGVPVVPTHIALTADDAAARAAELGYPVVLKLHSHTVTHKTDVGGVRLDLGDEAAVRRAFREIREAVTAKKGEGHFDGVTVQPMVRLGGYELIVGSSPDPQFGPVLLFGSGGQMVEVYRDRALALPPLNTTLARRLMEQTRIFQALHGVRGRAPSDIAALEKLLVRFSELVVEQIWIREIEINPLLVWPNGLVALDARVVLYGPEVSEQQIPKAAIRPYPARYVSRWKMKDGTEVLIRPIRPEDEPLMVAFHRTLSERSVYLRYFRVANLDYRIAHERLTRICFIDYDREIALVAEHKKEDGTPEIIAVGRLSKLHERREAEFALLVSDLYQRRGLGTELLRRLIDIGKEEGLERIVANILPENQEMQSTVRRLGYQLKLEESDDLVSAIIALR